MIILIIRSFFTVKRLFHTIIVVVAISTITFSIRRNLSALQLLNTDRSIKLSFIGGIDEIYFVNSIRFAGRNLLVDYEPETVIEAEDQPSISWIDDRITRLSQLTALCGSCAWKYQHQARFATWIGDLAAALDAVEMVVASGSNDTFFQMWLADLYVSQERWIEADAVYRQAGLEDIFRDIVRNEGHRVEVVPAQTFLLHILNTRFQAIKLLTQRGMYEQAEMVSATAIETAQDSLSVQALATAYALHGELHYHKKNYDSAINDFRTALLLAPHLIQLSQFQELYNATLKLPTIEESAQRLHVVDQLVGDYFLLAYQFNPSLVELGGTFPIILFWSVDDEFQIPSDCVPTTIVEQANCTTTIMTTNLFPDGGFEWYCCQTIDRESNPLIDRVTTTHLITDFDGRTFLELSNEAEIVRNAFSTNWIAIEKNTVYLQAGLVLASKGGGWLGHQWQTDDQTYSYEYTIANAKTDEWQHFATIIEAPLDAYAVEIQLLNEQANSRAAFDNVLLLPIGYWLTVDKQEIVLTNVCTGQR